MNPRPIYRWKSFWLGLCVMVFVGWACRFSLTHLSMAGRAHFVASHGGGGVLVGFKNGSQDGDDKPAWGVFHGEHAVKAMIRDNSSPSGRPGRMIALASGKGGASPWVKPLGFAANGQMAVFLPHWLVLLVMAVPWSAWLVWHWKQEQRKRTA